MAEIVNLRMARKRKTRQDRQRAAEENRIRHGRTGNERRAAAVERDRSAAAHEAHRREQPPGDGPPQNGPSGSGGPGDGGR